ncbi:M14 family metallocarboxypeptidase [Neiella marina]|uniref:M14 family metallocarboxypeptidase n=1 Tax=Neiella holothuriorum TaxID=2870530 RepID=A0ABS7EEE0_9GAMM|nr:M14 family metallocarboxypeptidase [Neiella holothuriorum]MBW8190589.1 M14 family metallocarboxypeptidase [Neiella holothuriorum]
MKQTQSLYPVGTPGCPWSAAEKSQWLQAQSIKRSYQQEVVKKLDALKQDCELIQYGQLCYEQQTYPLLALKSLQWQPERPVILVTGGVHGYETSGVQGAIRFAQTEMKKYQAHFNIVVVPCISPWGYESINRWNPNAIDPNRSFYAESPAQEAAEVMAFIASLDVPIYAHFDLHETTDSDNSEFRPALAARDGVTHDNWNIPDGFYLVGDTEKPVPAFQKAIIDAVEPVTHIAPADEQGKIIGAPIEQRGVINYSKSKLGLCGGFTNAAFVTTTEVYPDSPNADDETCIQAQVAAITGGLSYLMAQP